MRRQLIRTLLFLLLPALLLAAYLQLRADRVPHPALQGASVSAASARRSACCARRPLRIFSAASAAGEAQRQQR